MTVAPNDPVAASAHPFAELYGSGTSFSADTRRFGLGAVFGGQAIALAVAAASAGASEHLVPSSVHATMLAPGAAGETVDIDVDVLRDRPTSSHRCVRIRQRGVLLTDVQVVLLPPSTQPPADPAGAPRPPDTVLQPTSVFERKWGFEMLDVRHATGGNGRARLHPLWARARYPRSAWLTLCLVSDMGLVTAGLTTEELQRVVPSTVDHSVRFHAAASPGEWIQLQLGAVIRQPERAVVSAQLIGEDARRLASITQTVSYRWIV